MLILQRVMLKLVSVLFSLNPWSRKFSWASRKCTSLNIPIRKQNSTKDILPHPTEFEVDVNTWKVHIAEVSHVPSKSLLHMSHEFYFLFFLYCLLQVSLWTIILVLLYISKLLLYSASNLLTSVVNINSQVNTSQKKAFCVLLFVLFYRYLVCWKKTEEMWTQSIKGTEVGVIKVGLFMVELPIPLLLMLQVTNYEVLSWNKYYVVAFTGCKGALDWSKLQPTGSFYRLLRSSGQ